MSGLSTTEEKRDTVQRLSIGYPHLGEASSGLVDFLFGEAKSKYDAGRERSKALDAKAGTLITIVTTGFGAFAILGDPTKIGAGPLAIPGLVALGAAFVFALMAQIPRDVFFPELSFYVSLDLVNDPVNEVRVKYELTRSWLRDADVNDRTSVAKKRLLNISTGALGIGLAALTLNFAFPFSGEKPVPTFQVILRGTPIPSAIPSTLSAPTPTPTR